MSENRRRNNRDARKYRKVKEVEKEGDIKEGKTINSIL